jgi:hypothetical protein
MTNNLIERHVTADNLDRVRVEFKEAAHLFGYVTKAITDMENSIRTKAMAEDFKGDWAYNQAYLVGQLKALDFCKQLITR